MRNSTQTADTLEKDNCSPLSTTDQHRLAWTLAGSHCTGHSRSRACANRLLKHTSVGCQQRRGVPVGTSQVINAPQDCLRISKPLSNELESESALELAGCTKGRCCLWGDGVALHLRRTFQGRVSKEPDAPTACWQRRTPMQTLETRGCTDARGSDHALLAKDVVAHVKHDAQLHVGQE